jgi:transposase-like protein
MMASRPPTPTISRKNKRWTESDDHQLIELRASGLKVEAIASALDCSLYAIDNRWKGLPQWRKDGRSGPCDSEDISTKSSQERHQQPTGKASQIDAQSRRSFTTAHGWNPRSVSNTQEHSLPFSYGSQRLVRVSSWKRRGIFSLPYRPQRRLNHTGEFPTSGYAKRGPYQKKIDQPWPVEEFCRIIDLRAADYPWAKIALIMCRRPDAVRLQGLSLLKEERWLQRFEETKSTLPEDQRHKPPRNKRYSAKDDAVIVEMRQVGSTYNAIAQAMNRHPKSIYNRWKDNFEAHNRLAKLNQATKYQSPNETRKCYTSEDKEQLRQMAAQGTTIYHMAQVLGRSMKNTYGHLRTSGLHDLSIKSRAHIQGSWSESDDQILRSAIESGKRGSEVWQLIPERNPLDIWKRCQELGIDDKGIQASEFYWRAAEDAELLRLKADGKRYTEIGRIIGKTAE